MFLKAALDQLWTHVEAIRREDFERSRRDAGTPSLDRIYRISGIAESNRKRILLILSAMPHQFRMNRSN